MFKGSLRKLANTFISIAGHLLNCGGTAGEFELLIDLPPIGVQAATRPNTGQTIARIGRPVQNIPEIDAAELDSLFGMRPKHDNSSSLPWSVDVAMLEFFPFPVSFPLLILYESNNVVIPLQDDGFSFLARIRDRCCSFWELMQSKTMTMRSLRKMRRTRFGNELTRLNNWATAFFWIKLLSTTDCQGDRTVYVSSNESSKEEATMDCFVDAIGGINKRSEKKNSQSST
jgi:hypothetical protein